jgi:hypothetical protein
VNPVNDIPVAKSKMVETEFNTPVNFTLEAEDIENNPLTYQITVNPKHGTVSGTAPSMSYTPSTGFKGTDTVIYVAKDSSATSAPAVIIIGVALENHAPVAHAQQAEINEDSPLPITFTATDLENDQLTYAYTQPAHGTVTGTAPSVTYTPSADYSGADQFTFVASDTSATSTPATISITVKEVNDPPTAQNDVYTTSEDQPLAITAVTGVLVNDSDPENDGLTAELVTNVPSSRGALSLAVDGGFTFTPKPDSSGIVTFIYRAKDPGNAVSQPATVQITITAVNDPPVLAAIGNKSVNETVPLNFTISAADPDGGTAPTLSITGKPAAATFNVSTGAFSWTPGYSDAGAYQVTFKDTDNTNLSDEEPVTIMVNNVNRAPSFNSCPANANAEIGTPYSANITATDPDGDNLTYSLVSAPIGVELEGSVAWWMPDRSLYDTNTTHTIKVRVSDGQATVDCSWDLTLKSHVWTLLTSVTSNHLVCARNMHELYRIEKNGTTVEVMDPYSSTPTWTATQMTVDATENKQLFATINHLFVCKAKSVDRFDLSTGNKTKVTISDSCPNRIGDNLGNVYGSIDSLLFRNGSMCTWTYPNWSDLAILPDGSGFFGIKRDAANANIFYSSNFANLGYSGTQAGTISSPNFLNDARIYSDNNNGDTLYVAVTFAGEMYYDYNLYQVTGVKEKSISCSVKYRVSVFDVLPIVALQSGTNSWLYYNILWYSRDGFATKVQEFGKYIPLVAADLKAVFLLSTGAEKMIYK